MRLRKGNEEPGWTKPIRPLWRSRIPDIATLKQRLPGSVLVALDTEFFRQVVNYRGVGDNEVSDIGLAALCVDDQPPHFYPDVRDFHDNNAVDAFSIQIRKRSGGQRMQKSYGGRTIHANGDAKGGSTIESILSKYEGDRILIGYNLLNEFKWIAEKCPSISKLFTAWVDVQEMVTQRWDLQADNTPSLRDTLRAMHIKGSTAKLKRHSAVNDALRCLTVLSGLISNPPSITSFQVPSGPPGIRVFKNLRQTSKDFMFTVKITTLDGGKLPRRTPIDLMRFFGKYAGLQGVAMNWQRQKQRDEGVRFWWLSFFSQESLDAFAAHFNGSSLDGIELRLV